MKKIVLVSMAVVMVFALLGCATVKPNGGDPQNSAENPAEVSNEPSQVSNEPVTEVSTPVGAPTNPSESFGVYAEVKGAALQRVTDKIADNSDLSLSVGMGMLPVTMVDLSLLPLTVLSVEGAESALEMFGMTGVEVTHNGNDYSVSYSDSEGNKLVQTCKYDPATDSMQSSTSDGTNETIFFEYVRVGGGYASQYYIRNEDGTFMTITTFFNDTDTMAYGMTSSATKPASIIGNTSLTVDFVKNDEVYCILQGDALTVFENGETKTY